MWGSGGPQPAQDWDRLPDENSGQGRNHHRPEPGIHTRAVPACDWTVGGAYQTPRPVAVQNSETVSGCSELSGMCDSCLQVGNKSNLQLPDLRIQRNFLSLLAIYLLSAVGHLVGLRDCILIKLDRPKRLLFSRSQCLAHRLSPPPLLPTLTPPIPSALLFPSSLPPAPLPSPCSLFLLFPVSPPSFLSSSSSSPHALSLPSSVLFSLLPPCSPVFCFSVCPAQVRLSQKLTHLSLALKAKQEGANIKMR